MIDKAPPLDTAADYTTKDGANVLATRIRDFWYRRGVAPSVFVVQRRTAAQGPAAMAWDVRSNLVGGRP